MLTLVLISLCIAVVVTGVVVVAMFVDVAFEDQTEKRKPSKKRPPPKAMGAVRTKSLNPRLLNGEEKLRPHSWPQNHRRNGKATLSNDTKTRSNS